MIFLLLYAKLVLNGSGQNCTKNWNPLVCKESLPSKVLQHSTPPIKTKSTAKLSYIILNTIALCQELNRGTSQVLLQKDCGSVWIVGTNFEPGKITYPNAESTPTFPQNCIGTWSFQATLLNQCFTLWRKQGTKSSKQLLGQVLFRLALMCVKFNQYIVDHDEENQPQHLCGVHLLTISSCNIHGLILAFCLILTLLACFPQT